MVWQMPAAPVVLRRSIPDGSDHDRINFIGLSHPHRMGHKPRDKCDVVCWIISLHHSTQADAAGQVFVTSDQKKTTPGSPDVVLG